MEQQKTQQQITSEYLQNHQIVQSLEKALNLAIDHQISAPENFIADFLMKEKLDEDPYIFLLCIKQIGANMLFIVDFLGTLRHFTFPGFDARPPVEFPTEVYPELKNLNMLLETNELYAKCGNPHIFKCVLEILQVLLRETRIEQLARLINQPRQQFTIPRLIVPVLDISSKAVFGLVMRKNATEFVRELTNNNVKGNKFPFPTAQNEKTFDFESEYELVSEVGDGEIQSFSEFMEALRLEETTIEDTAREMEKSDKKDVEKGGTLSKVFTNKLSFQQELLACFQALTRAFPNKETCKIYFKLTREAVAEMLFSGEARQLEDLLLSIFMASHNDVILILSGFADLPKEPIEAIEPRSPSAKKAAVKNVQISEAEKQGDSETRFYGYDLANVQIDIKNAVNHYNQLSSYDTEKELKITIFSDLPEISNSIPFAFHEAHAITEQTELPQFYEKLCEMSIAEAKSRIVRFYVTARPEKPPSQGEIKRSKAQKVELETNTQKTLCSKSLAALLEEVEYEIVDNEAELYEFLGEIEGLLCEKRGYYL